MPDAEYYREQIEETEREIDAYGLFHPAMIGAPWMAERFRRLEELLISKLHNRHSILLDIGSRTGYMIQYLKARGFQNTLGIDISFKALTIAKQIWMQHNILADMHSLPFKSNLFHGIVMREVLEHSADYNLVLQETKRVLAPGGFFFCEVPVGDVEGGWEIDVSHCLFFKEREDAIKLMVEHDFFVLETAEQTQKYKDNDGKDVSRIQYSMLAAKPIGAT